ncbi:MAG: peptide chain release factor N(5)-glutamine methyltransferase [Erysipelotrichaceae bacterium]|nr:peptide chain release factor N(5)-glutamine methyltransferase [Erysipelotrichaceae bacterium]
MATRLIKEIIKEAFQIKEDQAFKQDVYYLAQKAFCISLEELLINENKEVDDTLFNEYFKRYLNGEPLYYILKEAPFYGKTFSVNSKVLIPRNETEELVLCVINYVKRNKLDNVTILDVGTGSGCIAVTLNLEIKDSKVTGVDISNDALEIAKKNNERLRANVNFYLSDCFDEVTKRKETYQIIVSNPPYIDRDSFVEKSVLDYEPHLALFADNKGLAILERLIKDIDKVLEKNGLAIFEISPEQEENLKNIAHKYIPSYQIEFVNDINNFVRFMVLKK